MQEQTPSRKRDHVELCVGADVAFQRISSGFEKIRFVHNALPECNAHDIDTSVQFLSKKCSFPLLISSMTGGYPEAEAINAALAEVAEYFQVPIGAGSQRQALENTTYHPSFRVLRKKAPSVPILANIGAAEIVRPEVQQSLYRIIELIEADALYVHLNPLQELLQPEGNTRFAGVLSAIASVVKQVSVPIFVKEVGAGLSGEVAERLLQVGVKGIDVAGAGGTSWAGVELLRNPQAQALQELWDWGIPTVECLQQCQILKQKYNFTLIASGGLHDGFSLAKAIALGADIGAAARVFLKILQQDGQEALIKHIQQWQLQCTSVMFLTGSHNIAALQHARYTMNT